MFTRLETGNNVHGLCVRGIPRDSALHKNTKADRIGIRTTTNNDDNDNGDVYFKKVIGWLFSAEHRFQKYRYRHNFELKERVPKFWAIRSNNQKKKMLTSRRLLAFGNFWTTEMCASGNKGTKLPFKNKNVLVTLKRTYLRVRTDALSVSFFYHTRFIPLQDISYKIKCYSDRNFLSPANATNTNSLPIF